MTGLQILVVASLSMLSFGPAQIRDNPVNLRPHTGSLGGTVVSDDDGRPVRRAQVRIKDDSRIWTAATDDLGRFLVRGLPPGRRYMVDVTKPPWIDTAYGALRPGRPGMSIALGQDEHRTDLLLKMVRGAVLTGTVTDRNGRPLPGARVTVMRGGHNPLTGEVTFDSTSRQADEVTDDRGIYRAFGLMPGHYVVVASTQLAKGETDFLLTNDADIERVITAFRVDSPSPAAQARQSVTYAPVFYPGTTDPARAMTVFLTAGEERGGIDFQTQLVPTAAIEVTLDPSMGSPPGDVDVVLGAIAGPARARVALPHGLVDKNGRRRFDGLPPGRYKIGATGYAAKERGHPTVPALFGAAEALVDGRDVSVMVELRPAQRISGRVVFDGPTPTPTAAQLAIFQIALRDRSYTVFPPVPTVSPTSGGRLILSSVPPGTYSVICIESPEPWELKSVVLDGRDVLDSSLEVGGIEDLQDLLFIFTSKPSELVGSLEDVAGAAAPQYYVVLFATESNLWTSGRRVRESRPASDGHFSFRNLPPGEYFLCALTDLEPTDLSDRSFLHQLVPASVRVRVSDGEKTIQNVRIAAKR